MFKFSSVWCYSKRNWKRYGKNIFDGKERNENINGTRIKTKFASVENPLTLYKFAPNETTLVSDSGDVTNKKRL